MLYCPVHCRETAHAVVIGDAFVLPQGRNTAGTVCVATQTDSYTLLTYKLSFSIVFLLMFPLPTESDKQAQAENDQR